MARLSHVRDAGGGERSEELATGEEWGKEGGAREAGAEAWSVELPWWLVARSCARGLFTLESDKKYPVHFTKLASELNKQVPM